MTNRHVACVKNDYLLFTLGFLIYLCVQFEVHFMNHLLFSMLVGLFIGIIDIIPMVIRKMPRYSIVAAFFHFFFVSIVILNIDIPSIAWWMEGGIVGFALMLPMLIHVGHFDKKPLPIIACNSILFGILVSIIGHYGS